MRKLMSFIVFAAGLNLFTSLAFASQTTILSCDNEAMVIERDSNQNIQLFINDGAISAYFQSQSKAPLTIVNDSGKLVAHLTAGGPQITNNQRAQYVGQVATSTYLSVAILDEKNVKISLWEVGYRGTYVHELANWFFRSCQ